METKRKNSKKRAAVLEALMSTAEHPSVETLYRSLKPSYPELSLGTVYRNLSVLQEEGLAVCVAHVDGQARYDGRTDPHAHFICRRCGSVLDMPLPAPVSDMAGGLAGELGCTAETLSLSVSGLCACCGGG